MRRILRNVFYPARIILYPLSSFKFNMVFKIRYLLKIHMFTVNSRAHEKLRCVKLGRLISLYYLYTFFRGLISLANRFFHSQM